MNLQNRIEILSNLGNYLSTSEKDWLAAKEKASNMNGWFTPEFVDLAVKNIITQFLQKEKLEAFAHHYRLDDNIGGKNVGIVMAGNIPLVGFHDFLTVFLSGHRQTIKLSSKDEVLLKFLVEKMTEMNPEVASKTAFAEMLKGCNAYIATGSNNSARYFDYYFGKYPCIIRRNRTSVAVLQGDESPEKLALLSDDIHQYFGLGCRNVTKIYVPVGYDFVPLLKAFDSYKHFADHHKYKNNYDYQLSIALLNNVYYMTNGSTLMIESPSIFSPISQVFYETYTNPGILKSQLENNPDIQCITGSGYLPFGKAQCPALTDFADGVDTMQFLLSL